MPLPRLGPLPSCTYSRARALGDGSYGCVCVAYRVEDGTEVAAKCFDEDDYDGSMTTETLREISALRVLAGVPGVVPLLDVAFEVSDLACVAAVLPLYPWSLADAVEDGGFRGPQVARAARGLLRAVDYLHRCQPPLVHRDIKPENVMLDAEMDAVLIDFSFCRFLAVAQPPARQKRQKRQPEERDTARNTECLGTPTYTAPEILRGDAYDERVDVWSLGVTLLEAFQKRRLETDRDKAALRLVAERRAQLADKPVAAVLRAMLEPEPKARASAGASLRDLLAAAPPREPAPGLPAPLVHDAPEVAVPEPVRRACAALNYRSRAALGAAARYLRLVGALEAARPLTPLFVSLVAGKMYEAEPLDLEDASEALGVDLSAEDYCEFEENLFRLSGCCLF